MACFLTVARHTDSLKHKYLKKQFQNHFQQLEAQALIPSDRRCRNNSACPPWGDARLFWHVRLIHLVVFQQHGREHQNNVCTRSRGQEGTMLAAALATVSDGMCFTSYQILVLVLSGEKTQRMGTKCYPEIREPNIRTALRRSFNQCGRRGEGRNADMFGFKVWCINASFTSAWMSRNRTTRGRCSEEPGLLLCYSPTHISLYQMLHI